jgi:uncharacterized membrane protein HdeD (DUF308 family)
VEFVNPKNTLKAQLVRFFEIWHLSRLLRLFIGSAFIFQGIANNSILTIVLGAAILLMGIFDYGCGSRRGCSLDSRPKK